MAEAHMKQSDPVVILHLNLEEALAIQQLLGYVRNKDNRGLPVYSVTRALKEVLGEQGYDKIRCVETDDYGTSDTKVIEEFTFEKDDEYDNEIADHIDLIRSHLDTYH